MKILLSCALLLLIAVPAWAGPEEIAGVYVKCPAKDPAACPQVADTFRRLFPNGQNAPFMLIRKDGRGYLAPDENRSTDFAWQFQPEGQNILLRLSDQKKTKAEFRREGPQLVNVKTGETYLLTIGDADWNPTPVPFKQINQKNKSRAGKAK